MDERAHDGGETGGDPGSIAHSPESAPQKTTASPDRSRQACLPPLEAQLPRAAGGGAGAVAALLATDHGGWHAAPDVGHAPAEPTVPRAELGEPVAREAPPAEPAAPVGDDAAFAAQSSPPVEPVQADTHPDGTGPPGADGEAGTAAGTLDDDATHKSTSGVEEMVAAADDAAPQSPPLTEEGGIAPAALDPIDQPLPVHADETTVSGTGEIAAMDDAAAAAATAPASEALPGEPAVSAGAALPTPVPAPQEQAEPAPAQASAPGEESREPEPPVSQPVPVLPTETIAQLIPEVRRAAADGAPALTPSVVPVLRPFEREAVVSREPAAPVAPAPPPAYFDPHPSGRAPRPGPVPPPPPALDGIPHARPLRPAAPAMQPPAAVSTVPPIPAEAPARPAPSVQPGRLRRVLRVALAVLLAIAVLQSALLILYRWVDPPTSMLMLGQRLTGTPITQRWVPLERMSPNLFAAVISSEDGHFCRHHGVDWGELREAIESAADGSARGGSTITMQVVKNVFLWPSRSYLRKAIEIPMAYAMELLWPKRRILEVYLNVAEWGPGIFGAEAASRYHFRKPALLLSQREAALLAVSLPNPIERQAGRPGAGTVRLADNLLLRLKASYPNTRCARIRALDDRAG